NPSIYQSQSQSQSSYDSIYKPIPPYSMQSYPPSNISTSSLSSSSLGSSYTSTKPFETTPLSTYSNINQSYTNERIISPTPKFERPFESTPVSTYSNINQNYTNERIISPTPKFEKPIDRPETLQFQHDEDIRSSNITKLSPLYTPSPDTPTIREEHKVISEPLKQTEDLSTISSAPIQILENTLNKYDSLINQISDILASVSPLSSTVSSMSPGKSVLDYEVSSDGSPILKHKNIESQLPQQSTTVLDQSSNISRITPSHLIHDHSQDNIITARSDINSSSDTQTLLDATKEETKLSSPNETQVSSTMEDENTESIVPSLDNDQFQLRSQQEKEEMKQSISDKHQTSSLITQDIEQAAPYTTEEEIKSLSLDEYQTVPIAEQVE
ncbi:unnamed protein product, partial [Adineta steineri]